MSTLHLSQGQQNLLNTGHSNNLQNNYHNHQDRYPDWPELINELKDQGVRIVTYINPFLVDASEKENATRNLFEEAQENGFLVKDEEGEVDDGLSAEEKNKKYIE